MRSGGGSMARIGVHVGQDWWTFLSTYEDHSPILDIAAGSTTVTVCLDGSTVTASAVEFARELAQKAAQFAAEAVTCEPSRQNDTVVEPAAMSRIGEWSS